MGASSDLKDQVRLCKALLLCLKYIYIKHSFYLNLCGYTSFCRADHYEDVRLTAIECLVDITRGI